VRKSACEAIDHAQEDPEIVDIWKWRGTPTFYHFGIVCTGETYENVVKVTLPKVVPLKHPSGLVNSSLEANVRRAIDSYEDEDIDEAAPKCTAQARLPTAVSVLPAFRCGRSCLVCIAQPAQRRTI
jgi:hypothetical protein